MKVCWVIAFLWFYATIFILCLFVCFFFRPEIRFVNRFPRDWITERVYRVNQNCNRIFWPIWFSILFQNDTPQWNTSNSKQYSNQLEIQTFSQPKCKILYKNFKVFFISALSSTLNFEGSYHFPTRQKIKNMWFFFITRFNVHFRNNISDIFTIILITIFANLIHLTFLSQIRNCQVLFTPSDT